VRDRTHEYAGRQVGQRRPSLHCGYVLVDRQRLAGEHALVAFQAGRVEQPDIRRDYLAQRQPDHVARYQVDDVDVYGTAVAQHRHAMLDLRMEGLGRTFRAVLVDETNKDARAALFRAAVGGETSRLVEVSGVAH
jgi:hypothetical protein